MAQDIVQGLFGPSPWQVQQQAQQGIDASALRGAQLDPGTFSRYMAGMAGGNLAQGIGGMFGLENPAVAAAKRREADLGGIDLSSPEAVLQKAATISDPRLKLQLQMMAQGMKEKQQEMALKRAQELAQLHKAQSEASPFAKIDPSKFTRESVKEYVAGGMKDPSVLDAAEFEKDTNDIKNYNKAVAGGDKRTFSEWLASMKKSGAATTEVKVDLKSGESLAKEIGPMLKDSKIALSGAMKMNDAADRIISAIDTGNVTAGPFASKVQTLRQFFDREGNNEKIKQTRQVIRALAESSVEARKELQGQGQVTENEALAVQKAMSGDIDSLTIEELRLIAGLNKKAAALRYQGHKAMLDEASKSDATKGLVNYFKVPGAEVLEQYVTKPQQMVGGSDLAAAARAELERRGGKK